MTELSNERLAEIEADEGNGTAARLMARELLSLRQSHSTGAVVPSDEFIDRLVVQLWRYREIDIDKAGLQMAVTDALRLSPVHKDVEAANCASEGHDHPAHDWREACLKCGVFRGSDLHAHLPKEAEVTVTEEMVKGLMPSPAYYSDGWRVAHSPFNTSGLTAQPIFTEQQVRAALVAALSRKG